MFAEGIRGGWGQGWFAWRPLALTMPRDRAIIFRDPVGKFDDSAQFRIESVRRTRRVLSSREFWHDRGTRRLYRLSGADATRRERRQFVGDKDPELSGLRARRRGSSPDKRRDLPGRLPRMDSSDLTTARFYPDYVSTKKYLLILLGPQRPALLIDSQARPFDLAAFSACVAAAPDYSMGFDAAVRAQSINDAVRFLQRNLQP